MGGREMRPRRRKRVDWDAEIRKSEQIRRRGLIMSGFSFALAMGVIVGLNRMGGLEIDIPRRVLSIACLIMACFLFRAVLKRRARLKREAEENWAEDEER